MSRALPTFLYAVAGLPLGVAWLTLLVTGASLGGGLLITVVGVFVLAATWELARLAAGLEARLAHALLGAGTAPPAPVAGLAARARSAEGWRAIGFLLSRFVLGVPAFAVLAGLVLGGLSYVAAPLWYWALPDGEGIDIGVFEADTLAEAVLLIPFGVAASALGLWLCDRATVPLRQLAEWGMPAADGRTDGRELRPVRWDAVLRQTTVFAVGVQGLLVAIWLATGAGYPWPVWPAIGLAVLPGVALVGALKDRFRQGRPRRLAVHAMLSGIVLAGLVAVWLAGSIGAGAVGYAWPLWPAVGLAAALGVHALMPERASRELRDRLARVEASRAAGVTARDDELGRIERDLHDGAQARLVAVALGLGRAQERMDADPERARELLAEASGHAQAAIQELRDLARGIAPPVLADRGVGAAALALAAVSPVDVVVRDRLGGARPPAPVERAAYFVVAEAIANAAKHVGPEATVIVDLDRGKHRLDVRVLDDGPGGADPAGSGLRGLAQRVEAVDGTFTVESEPAQGTLVRAALPWPGAKPTAG